MKLYESIEPDSIIDDVLGNDPNWLVANDDVGEGYALRTPTYEVDAAIHKPDAENNSLYFIIDLRDVPDYVLNSAVNDIKASGNHVVTDEASSSFIEWNVDSRYITKSVVKNLANTIAGLVSISDDSTYDNPIEVGESSSIRRYKSKTDFVMTGYRGSSDSWIRVMTYGPFTVIDHDLTNDKSYNGEVAVIVGKVGYVVRGFKEDYKKTVSDLRKFIPRAKYPVTSEDLLKQFHRMYLNGRDFERIKETSKGSADFKILNKYYRYV